MTPGRRIRTSPHVHVVPHPGGHAVYHGMHGNLCLMDGTVLGMLEAFRAGGTAAEVARATGQDEALVESVVEALGARRFLIDAGAGGEADEREAVASVLAQREAQLGSGGLIAVVQLVLTNRCNFRCKYCFTDRIYSSGERAALQHAKDNQFMSAATASAAIDLLIDRARAAGRTQVAVQFFGGEPLVNWETIRHVLDSYGDGSARGIRIGYSIVTNGSLITPEIARTFVAHGVAVVVSFDSPLGDDRPLAGGGGSRAAVEKGLATLAAHGARVVFNSVLSEETFSYFGPEVVDFGLPYGVREIGVLFDLDPGFYVRHPAVEIADRVWNLYRHGKAHGVLVTGYWHQIFQQIVGRGVMAGRPFKTCSATGSQLSVEPSGDVFACKGSSGYFGHVARPAELFASERYQAYARQALRNAPACEGCEIELSCGGLCLGSREKQFGTIAAIESHSCDVYRDLTRRLIADVDERQVDVLQVPGGEAAA